MIYLRLFIEFFFTGLLSIGGGLATLPFLEDIGARTGWFSHEMLADMIAISESTPGPIGVNMATYTGFHVGGVLGGIIATLGLITPSIIIILIIARVLNKFKENKYIKYIFNGLRPVSTALIAVACVGILKIAFFKGQFCMLNFNINALINAINFKALGLGVILYVFMRRSKLHPIVWIALAGVMGIVLKL